MAPILTNRLATKGGVASCTAHARVVTAAPPVIHGTLWDTLTGTGLLPDLPDAATVWELCRR